jgi:hypothetical protein
MARAFKRIAECLTFAVALCPGAGAEAQSSTKTMVAGSFLRLGHYASVNPDCTSRGKTVVRLDAAPMHGSIRLLQQSNYSNFNGSYEICNSRRVAGITVEYFPKRGFIGSDTVGLDVIYPSGTEGHFTFTIYVK